MIRKSKNNKNKFDFEKMMNEVEENIQEREAKQNIINRTPELRKLSENIDKATNGCVNATQKLELAIQQFKRAELKLSNAINTISSKIDTINEHIDKAMIDAPQKLKVSISVRKADWQKIQQMFDQEHKWMYVKMQEHTRDVNDMFVEECRKVQKRYKEYDGCYLGHNVQWFFWFFFVLGFLLFSSIIVMQVCK